MPGRELPMPFVSRITGLTQAHATLLHCWTRLSKLAQESPASAATSSSASSDVNESERLRFQDWLEQWEMAFTAYLSTAMASMATEAITECRILKTNHLACTIMAARINASTTKNFDTDFSAMLELAGAVLRSRFGPASSADELAERRALRAHADLDVFQPLQLVCTCSSQTELRRRAAELLMSYGYRLNP